MKITRIHALTEVGIEILPTGVVVEGPVQMGVAADDAHNVRLLIGGEGLRPGGHLDLEGGVCGDDAVGGGGRLGVGSGISEATAGSVGGGAYDTSPACTLRL